MPNLRILLAPVAFLTLAGTAMTARAQDLKLGEDPVSVIMKWRPTTPDPEVRDYVRASRPAEPLEYRRVAAPKVVRPAVKSKKDVKAMTDGLDTKAQALRAKGAPVAAAGNVTARQLQAAAAESRRRAAEAFGVTR